MLRIPTEISWSCDHQPVEGRAWVIYVSRKRSEKGVCWHRTWIRDRSARIQLWEGFWYIRVLMELCDCTEEPWERAEVFCHHITGREVTPIVPANAGVGVLPDGTAATAHDPARIDSAPHVIQVVECWPGSPGIGYGVLRDEYQARPGGVLEDPGHGTKRMWRMGGSVKVPDTVGAYHTTTREMCIGTMGLAGRRGSQSDLSTPLPELLHHPQSIQIAQVDTSLGTTFGFSAGATPYAVDQYELDVVEGFRTLHLPPQSDAGTYATMGPVDGPGTFSELPFLAPTNGRATIPTDITDLGSPQVFVLECYAKFCRTVTILEPSKVVPVCAMRTPQMHPAHDEDGHLPSELHQDEPQAYGPHYLMRDLTAAGEPRNPLRFCRFEYELDGGGWHVHVPGQVLMGQMIQVRIILFDETGWWQIATGDIEIRARFPERQIRYQIPWTPMTAPPGVAIILPVHPITGGSLFPNQMVAVASAQGANGMTMHVANVWGQAAGAAAINIMVWSAGGGLPALPDVVDVIVAGW